VRAFARLIPLLTIVISLLALYQIYGAVMFAISGQIAFGLFYALFGFAGLVLAWSLWSNRRRFSPPEQ
jgi:membrane associated rhomboid family serine protease